MKSHSRFRDRYCQCNPNIGKFCDDYPFCPYGYQERESNDNCNVCGMSEKEVKAHWDDKEPGFHFFKPKTTVNSAARCVCSLLIGIGPCAIHGWAVARKENPKT